MNLCKHGHDKDVVGVKPRKNKCGDCKECNRVWQRKYYSTVRGGNAKRAAKRRSYLSDPDRTIRAVKVWASANPEKVRRYKAAYRARNRGVGFWVEQVRNSA